MHKKKKSDMLETRILKFKIPTVVPRNKNKEKIEKMKLLIEII